MCSQRNSSGTDKFFDNTWSCTPLWMSYCRVSLIQSIWKIRLANRNDLFHIKRRICTQENSYNSWIQQFVVICNKSHQLVETIDPKLNIFFGRPRNRFRREMRKFSLRIHFIQLTIVSKENELIRKSNSMVKLTLSYNNLNSVYLLSVVYDNWPFWTLISYVWYFIFDQTNC